jgi:rhodanese-related sulfurtransferase
VHQNIESLPIPINEIPERIGEIPQNKPVGIFCPAHVRASMVYAYLRSKGYEQVRVLEGGYAALTDALKPGKILAAL